MRRAGAVAGFCLLLAGVAAAAGPAAPDRRAVIAAAARAPGAPEAWAEADALLVAARGHDRGVAGAAARALVGITRRYAADGVEDAAAAGWSADARAETRAQLAALATRPEVFVEVRVHAFEAAALLGDAALAARLAGDGDPEVRRAAAAWLDPARAEDAARLAELVAGDADAGVAATAAAVLCRAGAAAAARAAAARRPSPLEDGAADPGDAPALAACLRPR